jgi:hypothetical protein
MTWLSSRGARAEDTKSACIEAYTAAQELRIQGKWRDAAVKAQACSSETCVAWARSDCATWYEELRRTIPSIRVSVRDETGLDVTNARLSIDGLEAGVNQAIELDPGAHVVRVERPSGAPVEQRIVVRGGERDRPIAISVTSGHRASSETPSASESQRPVPLSVYGLSVGGAVSLGVFGFFAISAIRGRDDLYGCRPDCPQDRVDSVTRKFTIADVALGLGAVCLAGAAILYFTRPSQALKR